MTGIISEIGLSSRGVSVKTEVKDAKLRQACADFESIFVHYILKSARKALPQNMLFDNSHESKIYRSMLDQEMAQCMARGGGVGLGELLYEQLTGLLPASPVRQGGVKGSYTKMAILLSGKPRPEGRGGFTLLNREAI